MRRWWLVCLVASGACGIVPNDPPPEGGPALVGDCVEPLAFEGETTIAALDLVDAVPNVPADDATRRGTIRITRDPVVWEAFAPPDVPAVVDAGQMLCVAWDDGSGFTTLLQRPFVGEVGPPIGAVSGGGARAAPILVGLAAILVVAASWLAFRRGAGSGSGSGSGSG